MTKLKQELKGLCFAAASIGGYKTGNKVLGKIIDFLRGDIKSNKYKNINYEFSQDNSEQDIFEDIRAK